MGVQLIDTDLKGPFPPNTVGLLFGRSSTILRGLQVFPGVIDQDYTGTIKIMVSSPSGVTAISPGDRIAQLLLLPSLHSQFSANDMTRGDKGFGSSGSDFIALSLDMHQRPQLTLSIEGKRIRGLLDTGADKSIIAVHDWPKNWPIQKAAHTLQGLGYAKTPDISARELTWRDEEGNSGKIIPYVLQLPTSLWGRDILQAMKLRLTNESSSVAEDMMLRMGYVPGKGLGKTLQGRSEPIQPTPHLDKQGLGFS